jgi:hypothetical protein
MHQTCMALTSCYRFMHDENIVAGFRGSEEGYLMGLFQNQLRHETLCTEAKLSDV